MITAIKYGYTFNKGQFESERIDLEASVDPELDDPVEVTLRLRALVLSLGGNQMLAEQTEAAAEQRVQVRERIRKWYE